ncbi:hypothetical protein BV133_3030 [Blastochloris viridis]|uniref:Uncharacterized protein n=1 Tax=Blastochloris viridis TaxID=1079 RepID=A0A182D632_BLAVI|nr:hypothetical protein BV133_3030 [Blastochloris viridis]
MSSPTPVVDRLGDDDAELERRMRAKLFGGARPAAPGLSEEDQRIAAKLLGADNAERLARRRVGDRPFRPVPVRIHYEYWHQKVDYDPDGWWHIVRIENSKQFKHEWSHEDINAEIAALKAKGFTVREFRIGFEPREKDRKPTSVRREILKRIGRADK